MEFPYKRNFPTFAPNTPQGNSGSGIDSYGDEGDFQTSDIVVCVAYLVRIEYIFGLVNLTYFHEKRVAPFSFSGKTLLVEVLLMLAHLIYFVMQMQYLLDWKSQWQ